jgi:hypothetical protein
MIVQTINGSANFSILTILINKVRGGKNDLTVYITNVESNTYDFMGLFNGIIVLKNNLKMRAKNVNLKSRLK